MRPMLFCLDGSLAGRTLKPAADDVLIGADPDCGVTVPGDGAAALRPRHARLVRRGEGFVVIPLDGTVAVNGRPVTGEVPLREGDELTLGDGGPHLRFRLGEGAGPSSKTLRQMVDDSRDYSRRRGRTTQVRVFAQQFVKEAVANSTRPFKIAVLVLGAGVVALLGVLIWTAVDAQRRDAESHRRRAELERRLREDVDQENEALRGELAEATRRLEATLSALGTRTEMSDATLAQLSKRAPELDRLMQQLIRAESAARNIHARYRGGIAFLIVGCHLYNPQRNLFVRYSVDADGERVRRRGQSVVGIGGKGPKYVEWSTGSGFVVTKEGHIVTNRHVVDPWWQNEEDYGKGILAMGFRPVRFVLAASFPGRDGVLPVTRCGVSAAADVGLVRLVDGLPDGMPVVPMAPRQNQAETGQKSILLGFPLGYEGLMVKLEKKTREALGRARPERLDEAVAIISSSGGVKVTMTEGIIGTVTPERLVYDAVTTFGGSGGPLFNVDGEVIGINAAISRFAGANLGVPIGYARDLLEDGTKDRENVVDAPELAASAVK